MPREETRMAYAHSDEPQWQFFENRVTFESLSEHGIVLCNVLRGEAK
ncbi:MAG: hypothetical protein ACI835_000385 [Planctomycetota bacterium]|jgi:hypothetical protein